MREAHHLATAYWEYHRRATSTDRTDRSSADEYGWASEEVHQLVRSRPAEAVELVMELAEGAPDDLALAYLGAGPLEELLRGRAADIVVDRVEQAARQNARFRTALRCAWYDDDVTADVRVRLRRFGGPS